MLGFIITIIIIVSVINSAKKAGREAEYRARNSYDHNMDFQRQIFDDQNSIFAEQHLRAVNHADEMARMASTGIEFGGVNSDINLNPGMFHDTFNANNFGGGGFGMF